MASHSHSSADDAIQIDDPESGSTWFVSLAGSIIFVALVLVLCVLYFQVSKSYQNQVAVNVPVEALERARSEQKAKLVTPGPWVEEVPGDKAGEVIRIDRQRIVIDEAMRIVGTELSGSTAAGGGVK
jgi:hypothetical protein